MDSAVGIILYTLGGYTLVGLCLLLPFHRSVVPRLDESADGASWGFRALVSPGLIALWPVVLVKWIGVRRGRAVHGSPDAPVSPMNIRRMQRFLIHVLAIALPILIAAAIASRPAPPPPVELPPLNAATAGPLE